MWVVVEAMSLVKDPSLNMEHVQNLNKAETEGFSSFPPIPLLKIFEKNWQKNVKQTQGNMVSQKLGK